MFHSVKKFYSTTTPYSFGYSIQNSVGAIQQRKEEGVKYGNKRGTYSYVDPYGISRIVEYIADRYGFRSKIQTNEPGTANYNPAHVEIYAEDPPPGIIRSFARIQASRNGLTLADLFSSDVIPVIKILIPRASNYR